MQQEKEIEEIDYPFEIRPINFKITTSSEKA